MTVSGESATVKLLRLTVDLDDCLSTQDPAKRAQITARITDWRALVDYWAVDWDYRPGEPFRNDWQSFRTRKNREIAMQATNSYGADRGRKVDRGEGDGRVRERRVESGAGGDRIAIRSSESGAHGEERGRKMARRRAAGTMSLPGTGNVQEEIVRGVQEHVAAWVEAGYPGASDLTRELLGHWFGEPHLRESGSFFQWYPHQRRATETAIWLYEVAKVRRTEGYGELAGQPRAPQRDPWSKVGLQLATGSGKTKVMSLLMTWAHLHWSYDTDLGFGKTNRRRRRT